MIGIGRIGFWAFVYHQIRVYRLFLCVGLLGEFSKCFYVFVIGELTYRLLSSLLLRDGLWLGSTCPGRMVGCWDLWTLCDYCFWYEMIWDQRKWVLPCCELYASLITFGSTLRNGSVGGFEKGHPYYHDKSLQISI